MTSMLWILHEKEMGKLMYLRQNKQTFLNQKWIKDARTSHNNISVLSSIKRCKYKLLGVGKYIIKRLFKSIFLEH